MSTHDVRLINLIASGPCTDRIALVCSNARWPPRHGRRVVRHRASWSRAWRDRPRVEAVQGVARALRPGPRAMTSLNGDKWIGLMLAMSSSAAIGTSFIITKKVRARR